MSYARFDERGKKSGSPLMHKVIAAVLLGFVALVIFGIAAAALGERVEAGQHCVIRHWGKSDDVIGPGLKLTMPIRDSVKCYQTSLLTLEYTGVESKAAYKDSPINDPSSDGVNVAMAAYVEFRIMPDGLEEMHDNAYRETDAVVQKIVQPLVRDTVREVVTETPIAEIYPGGKTALSAEIESRLSERMETRGIELVSFRLTAVDPADRYEEAVQNQQQAEEDKELAIAEQAVAAEQAEKKRIEAKGEADAEIERARGEAEANQIIAESITPEILQLEYYEALRSTSWAILDSDNVMPTMPIPTPEATPEG